ncbi:hypothetical protein G9A89_003575 [Geosiphon pyriformis]|nr:hypothetical protein G9A89_003575 [Geosiphon pyriformis]
MQHDLPKWADRGIEYPLTTKEENYTQLEFGGANGITKLLLSDHNEQKAVHHSRPQSIKDKLKLYTDIWAEKDASKHEDEKLENAKRKLMRIVVSPANIIDEALITREEVIRHKRESTSSSKYTLSFRYRSVLCDFILKKGGIIIGTLFLTSNVKWQAHLSQNDSAKSKWIGVGKIDEHIIERIVRICKYLDD